MRSPTPSSYEGVAALCAYPLQKPVERQHRKRRIGNVALAVRQNALQDTKREKTQGPPQGSPFVLAPQQDRGVRFPAEEMLAQRPILDECAGICD